METFDWYTWVILPLIVFLARFVDVTLGTMRIIFLSRGRKFLAPALGFVEVFIWITVVSQIVGGAQNNLLAYFAYAAGFAVGNYVGMVIEEKLAIGTLVIRAIFPKWDGTRETPAGGGIWRDTLWRVMGQRTRDPDLHDRDAQGTGAGCQPDT
jgi:hypothetical protein